MNESLIAAFPTKALTLTQPWATLVAIGAKRFETRSWSVTYRGPLAIHAAKGLSSIGGAAGLVALCRTEPFRTVLREHGDAVSERLGYTATYKDLLPLGAIVAVADLTDVIRTETLTALPFWEGWAHNERDFGNYAPGRFAWHLRDIRALAEPIPCRGALGLWMVPPEIVEQAAE